MNNTLELGRRQTTHQTGPNLREISGAQLLYYIDNTTILLKYSWTRIHKSSISCWMSHLKTKLRPLGTKTYRLKPDIQLISISLKSSMWHSALSRKDIIARKLIIITSTRGSLLNNLTCLALQSNPCMRWNSKS